MRRFLAVAVFLALAALPAPAAAVLSGSNGLILFTSGRLSADGDDSQAKLFLVDGFSVVQPTFTPAAGQHRHGTWSPDRTKVAYARGTPGTFATEAFDIYVHDLVTGVVTPITDTGDNLTSDHPAWSPDGSRIAYEEETLPNNTGLRDIWVEDVTGVLGSGGRTNITA